MNQKIVAIIIAGALVVGGGIFFVMNRDEDTTNNESSQNSSETENAESKPADSTSNPTLPKQTVGQQPDCSLYSLEDIAGIWGVPMTDTDVDGSKVLQISGPQNYQYECDYNETDSGTGLTVSIQYKVYENEAAAQMSINNTRDGAKIGETVYFINDEVENIGDEAFFSKSAREGSTSNDVEEQLYARDGNVVYLITAVNLDGIQADARDKILETYRLRLQ